MSQLDIARAHIPGLDYSPAPRKLVGTSGDPIYRVSIRGQPAVVRFRRDSESCLGEESAQLRAAAVGLAPSILFANIDEAFIVSAYSEGEPLTARSLRSSPIHIQGIGNCLRRLHAIECSDPPIDLVRCGRAYVSLAPRAVADRAAEELTKLEQQLQDVPLVAPRFSHNDLVAENIIVGATYQFIDWAFARPNDPFFDLAVLAGHHLFDDAAQRDLLTAYGIDADSRQMQRLQQWVDIYAQLHWLWLIAHGQLDAARVLRPDIKF